MYLSEAEVVTFVGQMGHTLYIHIYTHIIDIKKKTKSFERIAITITITKSQGVTGYDQSLRH